MLDTARNFVPVTKIKEVIINFLDLLIKIYFSQLINSLSFGKMNVLHWHITDSQV